MPLLEHAVLRSFRWHRLAVEHARLADGEVGDIDHRLHLAVSLGLDLPVLERYEAAERILMLAKTVGELADRLATAWRGHCAPCASRLQRGHDGRLHVRPRRRSNSAQR